MRCKNSVIFLLHLQKQRLCALSGVPMIQRVVYVPFFSMRSVINPPERASFHLKPVAGSSVSDPLLYLVPAPRFTAMPEQDLTIWSAGLLFESILRATRELLHPFELRFAQIRKRDHA